MANPQKENGYTPISNELLEAFYCAKLTEYERVCMLHIWRQTYGWNKKEDWIANSQFSKKTGIPKPHITRTLKALKNKQIVTSSGNKTTVNKNYSDWKVYWRLLPPQVTTVTSSGNKKLPPQVPTKEKKETIQKTNSDGVASPTKYQKVISEANASAKLKDNKNNMSCNKHSDDYEEGVVDLDGDGSLEKEKKTPTRKYPNAQAVRKIFQEVLGRNPANWKQNKNQLQACENLVEERGLERIKKALVFYKEHEKEEYCPKIHSPYCLDSKWTKLGEYKLSL